MSAVERAWTGVMVKRERGGGGELWQAGGCERVTPARRGA